MKEADPLEKEFRVSSSLFIGFFFYRVLFFVLSRPDIHRGVEWLLPA